jgi:hypothetical protein
MKRRVVVSTSQSCARVWRQSAARLRVAAAIREDGFDTRALEDRSRRPHTSPTAISELMQDMVVWARRRRHRTRSGASTSRASSRPATASGARPSRSPTPTLGAVSGASWSRSPTRSPSSTSSIPHSASSGSRGDSLRQRTVVRRARARGAASWRCGCSGWVFASSGSPPGGRRRTGATSDPSHARGRGHLSGTSERARAVACPGLVRREYNEERPHQALGQLPPSERYGIESSLSMRSAPAARVVVRAHRASRPARRDSMASRAAVRLERPVRRLHPARARCRTRWAVPFGSILLGHIDGAKPETGLLATPRRRKSHVLQLQRA